MNVEDFKARLLRAGWEPTPPELNAPNWSARKGGWLVSIGPKTITVGTVEPDSTCWMRWLLSCSLCASVVRLFARRYDVPDILACLPIVRAVRSIHPSVLALRSGVYGRLP